MINLPLCLLLLVLFLLLLVLLCLLHSLLMFICKVGAPRSAKISNEFPCPHACMHLYGYTGDHLTYIVLITKERGWMAKPYTHASVATSSRRILKGIQTECRPDHHQIWIILQPAQYGYPSTDTTDRFYDDCQHPQGVLSISYGLLLLMRSLSLPVPLP